MLDRFQEVPTLRLPQHARRRWTTAYRFQPLIEDDSWKWVVDRGPATVLDVLMSEIMDWCQGEFGAAGDRWTYIGICFYLLYDDDAFAFKMRWC